MVDDTSRGWSRHSNYNAYRCGGVADCHLLRAPSHLFGRNNRKRISYRYGAIANTGSATKIMPEINDNKITNIGSDCASSNGYHIYPEVKITGPVYCDSIFPTNPKEGQRFHTEMTDYTFRKENGGAMGTIWGFRRAETRRRNDSDLGINCNRNGNLVVAHFEDQEKQSSAERRNGNRLYTESGTLKQILFPVW